jgi:hypothetical protein
LCVALWEGGMIAPSRLELELELEYRPYYLISPRGGFVGDQRQYFEAAIAGNENAECLWL